MPDRGRFFSFGRPDAISTDIQHWSHPRPMTISRWPKSECAVIVLTNPEYPMRFSKHTLLYHKDTLNCRGADWGTKYTLPEAPDDALLLRRTQRIFSCFGDVDWMLAVLHAGPSY